MECVIPCSNIKVFGRAVHALARIGDELYVDPAPDGVSLRTVNSSRSAYASVAFQAAFFTRYQPGRGSASQEEPVKCKVSLKACLAAFRSLASLEKTVEQCLIFLEEDNARLVVHMECKHKINKTYHISFIECETLQAVYSPTDAMNRLSTAPRLLLDAVANFQMTQEEVTLAVTPRQLGIRNYTDDEPDPAKAIRTALLLCPAEFDVYTIGASCEVTFCLRELRAVLLFAEPLSVPLTVSFDGPGKPIVFCSSDQCSLDAHFVLATLADRSDTQQTTAAAAAAADDTIRGRGRRSSSATVNGASPTGDARTASQPPAAQATAPAALLEPDVPVCTSTPADGGELERRRRADDSPPPAADGRHAAPTTPPAKRARFTFQRCFNDTMDPLRVPGHERVLAPDSDDD